MNIIEYNNKLLIIITSCLSKELFNKIKRKVNVLWNNSYKSLIISYEYKEIPFPNMFLPLVRYATKNNIKIVFE